MEAFSRQAKVNLLAYGKLAQDDTNAVRARKVGCEHTAVNRQSTALVRHPEGGNRAARRDLRGGNRAPEAVCIRQTYSVLCYFLFRKGWVRICYTPRLALCCARRDPHGLLCCRPQDDANAVRVMV